MVARLDRIAEEYLAKTKVTRGLFLILVGRFFRSMWWSSEWEVAVNGTRRRDRQRLDPAGSALVDSTYIGGAASDRPRAIAVDRGGGGRVTCRFKC